MRLRWKIAQAAEIRWWQNYLRKKEPMEYLHWKEAYWRDFLTKCGVEMPVPNAKCMDAGCGPAGIFTILKAQVVDAIDPLLEQYETKLAAFQQTDYPWVHFHASPIEQFESAGNYDVIFSLNAINHVSDWAGSIKKLMEWTKPGGSLLLSTDVHRFSLLKPIFRALPGDILHPHQHSLAEYIAEIEKYSPKSIRKIRIKREAIFDYWALVIER
jgi:2-polyprenyl-3-methyl-5-hydroxy-6-metoxy-1,4-benzoquinol methylase